MTGPEAQQRRQAPAPTSAAAGRLAEPRLRVTPTSISFGAVQSGASAQQTLTLLNRGWQPLRVQSLRFILGGAGNSSAFSLEVAGNVYAGAVGDIKHAVTGVLLQPRESIEAILTYAPSAERYDAIRLRFEGLFGTDEVQVDALGGHAGHPFLHVVIAAPEFVVDYDGDGFEAVTLDGSASHTHDPEQALTQYEWDLQGAVFSTEPIAETTLAVGQHTVTLTIGDDSLPPEVLSGSTVIDILGRETVPGVLAYYYDARAAGATALLDAPPADPDFAEVLPSFDLAAAVTVGGSLLHEDVMVRLLGDITLPTAGVYRLAASGGIARRILLKGQGKLRLAAEPGLHSALYLPAGTYRLDARFAVGEAFLDLPVAVALSLDGGPLAPIVSVSHDESDLPPIINSLPFFGIEAGGNLITLEGLGFFPADSVVVHWGGQNFDQDDFQVLTPSRIEFLSPPGTSTISVTVETPQGVSNARNFTYSPFGPVPINFQQLTPAVSIFQPTCGVWGPDEAFYVGTRQGEIHELRFDDSWNLVSHAMHAGVSAETNHEILGITVNPYDPPLPVRLYVSHGELFLNGGSSFEGPSPYTGQVSILQGPAFNSLTPLITGLPTSNHDHGVNGLLFDHNGDLLVSVGGNTSAGVRHPNSGDLPESPLSGAILKALTSKPGFNGVITYVETATGLPNDDQVFGELVDLAPGVDIEVHASGLRNSYDMVLTTSGRLYATDNGPNVGFGAASLGLTTEGPDPVDGDELLLIERGNYYGHANRSRGRYDARQSVYYGAGNGPGSIPATFTQMIALLPSSSNGIDEYRSNTFQGQLRGQLFIQEWISDLRRVELDAGGRRSVSQVLVPPFSAALAMRTGPGGTLQTIDYSIGRVTVLQPDDLAAVGLVVHDIFPWRAPAGGGYPFTISGVGFGDLLDTSVSIGGNNAMLSFVGPRRIRGFIPSELAATTDLLDVVVTVGIQPATLTEAFRYLLGPGLEPGRWEQLVDLPVPLGEVAGAVIFDELLLVGEGSAATLTYDMLNGLWKSNSATRPFAGHHHAAEAVAGLFYLVGGLGGGSDGRVQIFDPQTDTWSLGASMPWAAGSVATSRIGGLIYAAGGIVGGSTVTNCAVYDPQADAWTPLAPMPQGRNHVAAGTDGLRLYLFGGRAFGNVVTNGFDTVQIYSPFTNTWDSSENVGSTLAPLPQARGGMGKAIFHEGEFYIFGGETDTGPGATPAGVYDRLDVYDPLSNTWRSEAFMPSPRHGIFPLLFQGRMFLPGGGSSAGNSQVTTFDVFTRQ